MAQSKSSAESGGATVEELTSQIEALKGDIAAITGTLADLGAETRDQAKARVRDAASDVRARSEKHLKDAQACAEDLSAQATDAVRQQPAMAVGIAVGVGFLIGLVTARR
ncbi:DUF883 family protein [Roseovarius sp. ZX-A-9]|uniref:DUF883 family protein n=1 Tax=Roseovarius sp. ZX-A-9 TaxID=3014783 RepID=UPI00232D94AD|nr:hypothetical protein [Roseovarius sp. ZX-A-9]